MMTATKCPSAEQLRAFSLGRLGEQLNEQVFDHLRDCKTCQADLETVDDADDSLIFQLRAEDEHTDILSEPQCNVALAKALASLAEPNVLRADPSVAQTGDELAAWRDFPKQIGEYEIIRPIGRGGMGKVYLARQTKLGREVAVKVLASHRLADQRMRARFDAEMQAIGRLSHPNIVTAHDAREVDGTAVLITEFIDGLDLGSIINRSGKLSIANACEVGRKIAASLQYIGDQGFVHRDVKPSNIMISKHGEVKLLDLGLARYENESEVALTGTGQAIGTPDYVSPEQVTDGRTADHRSDIYSLGCTLFTLLTGDAPFAGADHQTAFAKMTAHVSKTAPRVLDRLPECPPELSAMIASMLEKAPAKRPASASVVASSLSAWCDGHDLAEVVRVASASEVQTRPLPVSTLTQVQPWYRRTVPISVAIAAGLMGVLVGLLLGLFIKITYPDGTVVELPVSGAKVEMIDSGNVVGDEAGKSEATDPLAMSGGISDFMQGVWNVQVSGVSGDRDRTSLLVIDGDQFYGISAVTESVTDYRLASSYLPTITGGTIKYLGSPPTDRYYLRFFDEVSGNTATTVPTIGSNDSVSLRWLDEREGIADPLRDLSSLTEKSTKGVTQQLIRCGHVDAGRIVFTEKMHNRPSSVMARVGGAIQQMILVGPQEWKASIDQAMGAAKVTESRKNLKQLGIAFHNFHATYQKFPGSKTVFRKEELPVSWRVAILPFINENKLYEQYQFDEPWDSESNLKLLDQMPKMYRSSRAAEDQAKGHTNYVGYATGNSALGQEDGVKMRDIRDGNSKTLLLVETKNTMPWTKPQDLTGEEDVKFFEPMLYALADGSVRSMDEVDPELLKKMITRDGGETISLR